MDPLAGSPRPGQALRTGRGPARRRSSPCSQAKSSLSSATTGPARARWSRCCPAPAGRDAGEILRRRRPGRRCGSPLEGQQHGIETVYQDLALAPDLDGAANLYLGRELLPGRSAGHGLGFLDNKAMQRPARRTAFAELGRRPAERPHRPSPPSPVANDRASRSPARWRGPTRLVFLDEPTAALGVVQTARVLDVIRRIRRSRHRRGPDQPQHAAGAGGLRPDRGASAREAGGAASSPRTPRMEQLVGAMTGALATTRSRVSAAEDQPGLTGCDRRPADRRTDRAPRDVSVPSFWQTAGCRATRSGSSWCSSASSWPSSAR